MLEAPDRGSELDVAEEGARVFVVAGSDATPLLQRRVPRSTTLRQGRTPTEAADGILAGVADADEGPDQAEGLNAAAALCRRLREVFMAHPGAARVLAAGPSRFTNERAITDRLLSLLSGTDLNENDVAPAYHALIGFTVGWSALDAGDPGLSAEDVSARHRTCRASYLAASPVDFPCTVQFASQLCPSLDEHFEFGPPLIVSGLRERSRQQTLVALAATG